MFKFLGNVSNYELTLANMTDKFKTFAQHLDILRFVLKNLVIGVTMQGSEHKTDEDTKSGRGNINRMGDYCCSHNIEQQNISYCEIILLKKKLIPYWVSTPKNL